MLHVTDGESVAGTLRKSGVLGEVVVFGDLMYDGRVSLRMPPGPLARFSSHEETVLWFSHSLSNQLMLIRALDWFSEQKLKLRLIPAGRTILGSLPADQLAALAPARVPVTQEQFATARTAWRAVASADRAALHRIAETGTPPLPFLAPAMRRYLEDMPSEGQLTRTQREALTVLRDQGPLTRLRLFFKVQKLEETPFMGDASFYGVLDQLAQAPQPLVRVDAEASSFEITAAGLAVYRKAFGVCKEKARQRHALARVK